MNISVEPNEISDRDPHQQVVSANSFAEKHWRNNLLQAKPRSAFAAIIAETYFIPGITGRARCLRDNDLPELATSLCDHEDTTTLRPMTAVGQFPESNPNSWEIEGRSQRSRIREKEPIAVWAETASFLRQANVRGTEALMMQKTASSRSVATLKTVASDSLSHSEGTRQTLHSWIPHNDDNSVACSSDSDSWNDLFHARPFALIRERWGEYQQHPKGSKRTSLLHEQVDSIKKLLTQQRARVVSHDSLQGHGLISAATGARSADLVRAASSRSCHRHGKKSRGRLSPHSSQLGQIPELTGIRPTLPARALSARACLQHEGSRQRRRPENFPDDLPPLVVSFHLPQRKRATRPPSA